MSRPDGIELGEFNDARKGLTPSPSLTREGNELVALFWREKVEFSITEICRELRRNATNAELVFWEMVRNRQVMGYKFHRQYPIIFECDDERRFFIADFYCHALRLVIEIDGGIHETQKDYDKLRSVILSDLGYRIIRFSNSDVLEKKEKVVNTLEDAFLELTS